MKLTRAELNKFFEDKWCPTCNEHTDMSKIITGFPGIVAQRCKVCELGQQANYLEPADEIIDIPDKYRFPE